ncbi:MAG: hypothetical protein CMH61_00680 [Nanoarchaeota archaeon]|nr:hypothetical protein [Nanoarchaeota archaeon]
MTFLKAYLITAVIMGILGLVDSLLFLFGFASSAFTNLLTLIVLFFFIFNIIALRNFVKTHLPHITRVLPIYHIVSYIIFMIVGIYTAHQLHRNTLFMYSAGVGLVSSVFEIVFSLYLMKRFKL